jgi:hypothetical protein
MTTARFPFQADCVRRALAELDGPAVNCGANEDPAHLKQIDPARVINCDLFDHDQVLDRPNQVDRIFDAARDRWPFKRRECAIVVLGDILEHLAPIEIHFALKEARRVSQRLCVTVPQDDREENNNERADLYPRGAVHRTVVSEDMLRGALAAAGWNIVDLAEVEYDSGACWGKRVTGFFVQAE